MTAADYATVRASVIDAGYGREVEWAQTVAPPASAFALFCEYGWVVVNSGMKNQVAERIWGRILAAIEEERPVAEVFRHPGKVVAIQAALDGRQQRFAEYGVALGEGRVVEWCESLPWIGGITKWHLAKNLGYDCAKPDRWLERVATAAGESVPGLCERLAAESGDRIGTVDLVIWRACNLGLPAMVPLLADPDRLARLRELQTRVEERDSFCGAELTELRGLEAELGTESE